MDRGVATEGWLQRFPSANIHHLPHSFSDYYPLLISLNNERRRKDLNSFNFKAWWMMEESFEETVAQIWNSSNGDILVRFDLLRIGLLC